MVPREGAEDKVPREGEEHELDAVAVDLNPMEEDAEAGPSLQQAVCGEDDHPELSEYEKLRESVFQRSPPTTTWL